MEKGKTALKKQKVHIRLKPDKYLSNYYPNEINASKYRSMVEIQNLYNTLEKKFDCDDDIKKLPTFAIPINESIEKSLTLYRKCEKD